MPHPLGTLVLIHQQDSVPFHAFLEDEGYAVLSFDGANVLGKQDLFKAVQAALPASEGGLEIQKWAGLNDVLWNAIFDLESPRVVLIWENCERILEAGLADFITACDLFSCLSRDLQPKGIEFTLVVMGEGGSFPRFLGEG